MKLTKLARLMSCALLGLLLLTSLSACSPPSEEEAAEEEDVDAPTVPLPGTMAIDLSLDVEAASQDSADMVGFAAASLGINHGLAAIIVAGVNVNVALQLAIPSHFLKEGQSATARLEATNTYIWSYEFEAAGKHWTGNLTGVRDSQDPELMTWSLVASNDVVDANGCCDEFTYFTGQTTGEGFGSWQIFDPRAPDSNAELFAITYDIADPEGQQLLFEVNSSKDSAESFGNGSTIRYNATTETINMVITDSKDGGASTTIAWDRETKAGSFENVLGDIRCWDTEANDFANVECSGSQLEGAEILFD